VLVVQANPYNQSRLATVIVAVITSTTRLAAMPGNVFLPAASTGLSRDSVVNVTALATLDRSDLVERGGKVSRSLMRSVDDGLRLVLGV
jgi:mRNA interferase MazF